MHILHRPNTLEAEDDLPTTAALVELVTMQHSSSDIEVVAMERRTALASRFQRSAAMHSTYGAVSPVPSHGGSKRRLSLWCGFVEEFEDSALEVAYLAHLMDYRKPRLVLAIIVVLFLTVTQLSPVSEIVNPRVFYGYAVATGMNALAALLLLYQALAVDSSSYPPSSSVGDQDTVTPLPPQSASLFATSGGFPEEGGVTLPRRGDSYNNSSTSMVTGKALDPAVEEWVCVLLLYCPLLVTMAVTPNSRVRCNGFTDPRIIEGLCYRSWFNEALSFGELLLIAVAAPIRMRRCAPVSLAIWVTFVVAGVAVAFHTFDAARYASSIFLSGCSVALLLGSVRVRDGFYRDSFVTALRLEEQLAEVHTAQQQLRSVALKRLHPHVVQALARCGRFRQSGYGYVMAFGVSRCTASRYTVGAAVMLVDVHEMLRVVEREMQPLIDSCVATKFCSWGDAASYAVSVGSASLPSSAAVDGSQTMDLLLGVAHRVVEEFGYLSFGACTRSRRRCVCALAYGRVSLEFVAPQRCVVASGEAVATCALRLRARTTDALPPGDHTEAPPAAEVLSVLRSDLAHDSACLALEPRADYVGRRARVATIVLADGDGASARAYTTTPPASSGSEPRRTAVDNSQPRCDEERETTLSEETRPSAVTDDTGVEIESLQVSLGGLRFDDAKTERAYRSAAAPAARAFLAPHAVFMIVFCLVLLGTLAAFGDTSWSVESPLLYLMVALVAALTFSVTVAAGAIKNARGEHAWGFLEVLYWVFTMSLCCGATLASGGQMPKSGVLSLPVYLGCMTLLLFRPQRVTILASWTVELSCSLWSVGLGFTLVYGGMVAVGQLHILAGVGAAVATLCVKLLMDRQARQAYVHEQLLRIAKSDSAAIAKRLRSALSSVMQDRDMERLLQRRRATTGGGAAADPNGFDAAMSRHRSRRRFLLSTTMSTPAQDRVYAVVQLQYHVSLMQQACGSLGSSDGVPSFPSTVSSSTTSSSLATTASRESENTQDSQPTTVRPPRTSAGAPRTAAEGSLPVAALVEKVVSAYNMDYTVRAFADTVTIVAERPDRHTAHGHVIQAMVILVRRITEALASRGSRTSAAWVGLCPMIGCLAGSHSPRFEWYSPEIALARSSLLRLVSGASFYPSVKEAAVDVDAPLVGVALSANPIPLGCTVVTGRAAHYLRQLPSSPNDLRDDAGFSGVVLGSRLPCRTAEEGSLSLHIVLSLRSTT